MQLEFPKNFYGLPCKISQSMAIVNLRCHAIIALAILGWYYVVLQLIATCIRMARLARIIIIQLLAGHGNGWM